jgi:hypothetical protein
MDVAVCSAGYNTFGELMLAGVPSVFLPQAKIADEQDRRAERAVAAGAAIVGANDLAAAVAAFRDPAARQRASEAARRVVPENRARAAAAELLRLVAPEAAVDIAEAALGDDELAALRDLDADERALCDTAQALAPSGEPGLAPPRGVRPAALVRLAITLLARTRAASIPDRVVTALARRLPAGAPADRAEALAAVALALAPFSDGAGAALFARSVAIGKQLSVRQLGERLVGILADARARGDDLYRAAALVAGEPEEATS